MAAAEKLKSFSKKNFYARSFLHIDSSVAGVFSSLEKSKSEIWEKRSTPIYKQAH